MKVCSGELDRKRMFTARFCRFGVCCVLSRVSSAEKMSSDRARGVLSAIAATGDVGQGR